jgi:hypothetical protein
MRAMEIFLLFLIAFTLLFGRGGVLWLAAAVACLGVLIGGVALLLLPFLIWPPETIFGIAILLWCPLLIIYRLIVGWEP